MPDKEMEELAEDFKKRVKKRVKKKVVKKPASKPAYKREPLPMLTGQAMQRRKRNRGLIP